MSLLETKTIQLKTLSPVHIQCKDSGFGQGFVRRDALTAYAIDSDKLGQYLFEKTNDFSLVEKYADLIEAKARINKMKEFDFEGFLLSAGIYHHEKLKTHEKDLIQSGVFKSIVTAPEGNQFIRNRANVPFIPGSSLKGAIKTAVMFHLLQEKLKEPNSNYAKTFIGGISDKIDAFEKNYKTANKRIKDKEKGRFSQELQWFIFQNGVLKFKPELDFFRCVKVKDSGKLTGLSAKPVAILSLSRSQKKPVKIVEEVKIQDGDIGVLVQDGGAVAVKYQNRIFEFRNKIYKKDLNILQENVGRNIRLINCGGDRIDQYELLDYSTENVEPIDEKLSDTVSYGADFKRNETGTVQEIPVETFEGSAEMHIVIDHFLLNGFKKKGYKIPFSNIEELMDLVGSFGEVVWQFESQFFDSFSSKEIDVSPVCGFYSGFKDLKKLRMGWGTGMSGMTMNMLLKPEDFKKLRNKMFVDREDFPATKSRRVICDGKDAVAPLGWMEISKIL